MKRLGKRLSRMKTKAAGGGRQGGPFGRGSIRCVALLFLVGLAWISFQTKRLAEREREATVQEKHERSLQRILRQHAAEIRSAVGDNMEWFSRYLSHLRSSASRAAVASEGGGHEEESEGESGSVEEEHSANNDDEVEAENVDEGTAQTNVEKTEGAGEASHGTDERSDRNQKKTKKQKQKKTKKEKGKSGSSGGVVQDGGESGSNLGAMDMPMKKVHGHLKPCLDLLPANQLATLQLPPSSYSGPLKRLRYYRVDGDAVEIEREAGVVPGGRGRSAALELFWGRPTMAERSRSYEVKPSMEVHCGFAGRRETGFSVQLADESYLKKCQVAVVTATFGGGDSLAQPIGMTQHSLDEVCYVAFWDEVTSKAMAEEGVRPDPKTKKVGIWRIVVVSELPFVDQRLNGKIPKILTHRLLPRARFSIWVDSKYQLRRDPLGVLEALLWRPKAEFAISEHGARSCIYKEGEAVVAKHKAGPEEVAVQLNQYRAEGLPENATFNGKKALAEASIIVREHTPTTNLFMCLWFNEMVRFTARDQLSFGYVIRRLKILKPNMFPVCTRRAIVNVLGHKRKARPLH